MIIYKDMVRTPWEDYREPKLFTAKGLAICLIIALMGVAFIIYTLNKNAQKIQEIEDTYTTPQGSDEPVVVPCPEGKFCKG